MRRDIGVNLLLFRGAVGLYMREVARGVARERLAACATGEMCTNMKTAVDKGEAGCSFYFYLFVIIRLGLY